MTETRRRASRRKVSGVLLLDKPEGLTSNAALQRAKWLYQADKGGHTGTLDPFASGLLPICLGEATKFSQYLLEADKTYVARIGLGTRTTTADPEGEVIDTRPVEISLEQVRAVLPRFIGVIRQTPPMHSALKHAGRPLYEYARKGVEIAREARAVVVHDISLDGIEGEDLAVTVHCGKGLYVRTLAEDIGAALGCGAYLKALRRTRVGPFDIADALGFEALDAMDMPARDACLRPGEDLVVALPAVDLDVESAWQIRHGQAVWRPGLRVGERYRLRSPEGRFLGVAEVNDDGKLAPRRLVVD